MRGLAELQRLVRDAVVLGDSSGLEPALAGGARGCTRLAIHQRHYRTSLVTALLERFPATVWLTGSTFVTEAAAHFVREHPPTRPCIAEYGEAFPAFIARRPGAEHLPYLRAFAELEWHIGRLSLAAGKPALTVAAVRDCDAAALERSRVALQPGLQYLHVEYGVDELLAAYLSDNAPDRFALAHGDVWLELGGDRGALRMTRLTHAAFLFRTALAHGRALGDAALRALDVDETFDAGAALLDVLGDGVVTAIESGRVEGT